MRQVGKNPAVAPPQTRCIESAQPQVEAAVGPLTREFLERTRGDVVRLGHLVERAREGNTSVLAEIGRLTHSIHGTGAMFGYSGISAAAALMETWACDVAPTVSTPGAAISRGLLEAFLELIRRLAQEINAAARAAPQCGAAPRGA